MSPAAPVLDGWPIVAGVAAAWLYAATLGGWVLRRLFAGSLRVGLPALLVVFLASVLGFALAGSWLFVLGLADALTPWGMAIGLFGLWAVAAWWGRQEQGQGQEGSLGRQQAGAGFGHPERLPTVLSAVMLAALGLGLVWVSLRAPGHWDDTSYHLPVARHYLQHGGLDLNPWLRFPLFPHHANLLFTVALRWGGEAYVQAVANAIPLTLTAMGLVGLAQWRLGSTLAGWVAVVWWLSWPPVSDTLGYAYVDHWLTLYAWGACAALMLTLAARCAHPFDARHRHLVRAGLVVGAIAAGAAASTKLFGALIVLLLGLMLLFRLGPRSRGVWIYAGLAALFGLGWYLRSWIISGDPIHPAGGNLFGHFLWNAEDLLSQHQEQRTHGGSRNPLDLWASLQKAGIGGVLLGLAVVMQPRLWRGGEPLMAGLLLVFLLLWQAFFPPHRYTLPLLPLAAFLGVSLAYHAGWAAAVRVLQARCGALVRWAGRGAGALAVAASVVLLGLAHARLERQLEGWEAALEQRSGFALMHVANGLQRTHGSTLLHLGYENAIYFFEGTAVGDWFGPGRYSQWMRCGQRCGLAPPDVLVQMMERFQARMAAVNAARFAFDREAYGAWFEVRQIGPTDFLLLRKP